MLNYNDSISMCWVHCKANKALTWPINWPRSFPPSFVCITSVEDKPSLFVLFLLQLSLLLFSIKFFAIFKVGLYNIFTHQGHIGESAISHDHILYYCLFSFLKFFFFIEFQFYTSAILNITLFF